MNDTTSEQSSGLFSENSVETADTAPKVPSIPETFVVLLITVGFTLFVSIIFLVISLFYPLNIEILLVEAFIIVPAVVFVMVRGYSLRHIFRFNPIDRNQLYATIVIALSLIVVLNFLEYWLQYFLEYLSQYFPYPDWYNEIKSTFESDIIEMFKIDTVYKFIVLFLSVVVFAAVCEEMFFRGFIQQSLENRLSTGWAIFLTAFMFSILHPLSFIPILVLAVIIGIISWRSNSIIPTIIIHALNNGISLYALNTSEEIQADPSMGIYIPLSAFIISIVVLIVSMRYYFQVTGVQKDTTV